MTEYRYDPKKHPIVDGCFDPPPPPYQNYPPIPVYSALGRDILSGKYIGPTYMGAAPEQGEIWIGSHPPREGYASIVCGNTTLHVPYTVLRYILLDVLSGHTFAGELYAFQRALNSITCEASQGRAGLPVSDSCRVWEHSHSFDDWINNEPVEGADNRIADIIREALND